MLDQQTQTMIDQLVVLAARSTVENTFAAFLLAMNSVFMELLLVYLSTLPPPERLRAKNFWEREIGAQALEVEEFEGKYEDK